MPLTITQPVSKSALMRRTTGASYHHWLLACDRWLAEITQGTITGTYSLAVSEWDWKLAYESDFLPSDAVKTALSQFSGVGGGLA